ncbi:mitochondrial associated ribonuclease [Strigomonas culicis]|uniref:Mitochondrial associated ribonuclease n=1 Tax=Strigomonas culicis TaxID=28005 RepID=S9V4V3_9TRYP|nr:mitochondrial associated ribonuclease [Strigomonas culicis]EPY35918.1 mitochondrial associated ribonuclease [Strigomonas culicis]|eukprot:EPY18971.1 mitochondrial associated ribonuclease [Strigomonas culicis]
MINPASYLLAPFDTCRTAFLCCDIQETLRRFIPGYEEAVKISNRMARLQECLTDERSVYLVTAQRPDKIGWQDPNIKLPASAKVFAKSYPSMLTEELAPYVLGDPARGIASVQQVVLWGHETQVCVMQTANVLLQQNIRVAIAVDGCASQKKLDHDMAVLCMSQWKGLTISTSSSIFLQLGGRSDELMPKMIRILKD